jgi:hypothetical protein
MDLFIYFLLFLTITMNIDKKINEWLKSLDPTTRELINIAEKKKYDIFKQNSTEFDSVSIYNPNWRAIIEQYKKTNKSCKITSTGITKTIKTFMQKLSPEDIASLEEKGLILRYGEELVKEEKELISLAKPLNELIFQLNFEVLDAYVEPNEILIYKNNGVYGPCHQGHHERTGYNFKTILNVQSKDNDISELVFLGYDGGVRGGDKIIASILAYEEETTPITDNGIYIPRDFKNQEEALELIILNEDNKQVKKIKSIDYNQKLRL